jgi:hypothetical protein
MFDATNVVAKKELLTTGGFRYFERARSARCRWRTRSRARLARACTGSSERAVAEKAPTIVLLRFALDGHVAAAATRAGTTRRGCTVAVRS